MFIFMISSSYDTNLVRFQFNMRFMGCWLFDSGDFAETEYDEATLEE